MGFNQRRMARERAAAERAEQERRQRELGRDAVQAEKLVAIWNSRPARKVRPSFYPTIETALLAGAPWLAYQCPSCQLIGDVDLRTLDRHPNVSPSQVGGRFAALPKAVLPSSMSRVGQLILACNRSVSDRVRR
jgi:hypothetical protein